MKIVMNKAMCIIHNCVLYSTNYGVENYVRFIKKTNQKPADQPTFENVGQSTTNRKYFIDDLSVHTVDNIACISELN